ncbi:hypothetical protein ABT009_44665 [Streptomyces sp. NPDC002896]|uniref:hypothetical protein n=1 Tax=Streptomyces sp. NPDC002896 TaxID=3154438 RepID=UPI003332092B
MTHSDQVVPRGNGRGMGPGPDRGSIEHRLITMRRSLAQLDALGPVDRACLDGDPATGLVVERILALMADLAFGINCHVAAAVSGEAPKTFAASFRVAENVGMLDERPAAALLLPDGPHVLVQLCLDTEPDEVAAVVSAAGSGYREYLRQAASWAANRAPEA